MKTNSPRRYKIEGLGEWGIAEGSIFDNWTEREFDWREISRRESARSCFGLDFGYTNDPTAFMACLVDPDMREIYIFDEHYERAMTNPMIANMIRYKGFAKERIVADAAEPKSIEEIRLEGIYHITEAQKGKDSILNGIQHVQQYTTSLSTRDARTPSLN